MEFTTVDLLDLQEAVTIRIHGLETLVKSLKSEPDISESTINIFQVRIEEYITLRKKINDIIFR